MKMASFEEQLRWKCPVGDGVILQDYDNMILQKSYYAVGHDYESEDLDYTRSVSKYLSFVFSAVPSGWVMSVNNIILDDNTYLDMKNNHFYHPLLQLLEKERHYFFTRDKARFFRNIIGITFTFAPSQISIGKLGKLFISNNEESNEITNLENYLQEFNTNIELYTKLMSRAMKFTPMSYNETLSYLNYLVSHEWINFKLPTNTYINIKSLLTQGMIGGIESMVGDKHVRIVAIDNYFPDDVDPLTLERLAKLGFSLRWNTKYYFYNKHDSQQKMMKLVQMHEFNSAQLQMSKDADPKINRGALYLSDEANEALAQTYLDHSNYGQYSCHIVLMHENKDIVVEQSKKVKTTLMEMEYKARIESYNLEDAYFSSLDGDIENDQRRSFISTHNLADLLPLSGFWSGLKHHPSNLYPPESNPLFVADCDNYQRFNGNIFSHDLGHGLIIGKIGYGKSSLGNFLMASHFRYENSQVIALDYRASMSPLCYGVNGNFYDLGNDEASFQPFAEIDIPKGYDFAIDWVETICELNHVRMTIEISSAIRGAMTSLTQYPVELRTVQNLRHHASAFSEELAGVLELYSGSETLQGRLFSATVDKIGLSQFVVFEMQELIAKGDRVLIPALKYIFYKIAAKLDGRPTLIFIEEADTLWQHPLMAKHFDEWLKTLRKLNVAVWMVATQPDSIIESPIKGSLLNLCPTKIFTGNKDLKNESIRETYKTLGLSDAQLDLLKEAMPKRHYYITNPEGSRLFNLDLDNFEIAKAFFARTSKDDTTKAKELHKIHGTNFAQAWIMDSGIDYVQLPTATDN